MKRRLVVATALVAVLAVKRLQAQVGISGADATTARYHLTIPIGEFRSIEVDAWIPVRDGRFFMDSIQAQQLPRGWATFVRRLVVTDSVGRAIPFDTTAAAASWTLKSPYAGMLHLRYGIDLGYTRGNWPTGPKQSGQIFDSTLYTVTKALFITSSALEHARVDLSVPEGWRISAPWNPIAGTAASYSVDDGTDLLRNTLVIGHYAAFEIHDGAFTVLLALPGQMRAAAPLLEGAVRKVIHEYILLFPRTPQSRVLVTFFYAGSEDGEAFRKAATFTTADSVTVNSRIIWGNFVAHELFHHWNGQAIRGVDVAPRQYFNEGFTEYIANRTIARTGLVSPAILMQKIGNHLGLYTYFRWAPPFADVSLQGAGRDKTQYRFGVYDGGWTLAFCLDGAIREQTHDTRSLDDVMRRMYDLFGLPNRPYRTDDIARVVGEVAGMDYADFFGRYVSGTATLSVADCLHRMGLEGFGKPYSAELYVFPNPAATPAEVRRRMSLTATPGLGAPPSRATTSVGPGRGSLLVVGGGALGLEIYQRFIALAGGPDALIVDVPTAGGDSVYSQDWSGAKLLRAAGARNVVVLHTLDRRVAESDSFVAPLKRAGGVWFDGGRHWRLVDVYLDTKSEHEFHDVLARGGIIGGTSAGASIQASYLVRAAREGNAILIAPDYQRGFGFLRNVAIDQHVVARDRLPDLADSVMPRHPELLGLSEDEGTAWLIQGDAAEIIGRSKAFVYGGKDPPDSGKPFLTLRPGDRYNLASRRLTHRAIQGSRLTESFVDSLFTDFTQPLSGGATVLVAQDGHVLIDKAYGQPSPPRYLPATTIPNFPLHDISATFNTAVLRLRRGDSSHQQLIASRIFGPLGMTRTTWDSGGVSSNVDELYRWDQGLYADPALSGPGWRAETYHGLNRQSAYGGADGKRHAFLRFPDQHAAIIVLTGRPQADARAIADRIANRLLAR